ncbi:oxidoreductase [Rhodospirillaceae bacterium KN72]|uniref:Oxidoreductase n=1 Tax=Pacificispira spongiicola TaxID=2729598 RepID=A0A7Y0E1D4_9PROT|nr:FAD-dependent oxidoreductase [Pacificispira spongiicola]NMM45454.1 oxidoreductase [Pacificispira spongiicola]
MSGPSIIIVGASLAGLRTAEAIVALRPDARVTLVGAESHPPYNRPPLSKEAIQALADGSAPPDAVFEKLLLRSRLNPEDVNLRLGRAVTGVESDGVRLSDGSLVRGEWIIAATGLRPRRLPIPGMESVRHVLRSFDDAQGLAAELQPGKRLLIVGAGFIGCEIAATARKLGLSVTLVDPTPQPMLKALGARVAAAMAQLHRANGVHLILGRFVESFTDGSAILDDGQRIETDLVVEAMGSRPNTEWLSGTGADLEDGVLVDGRMVAAGTENLLAVGDVARFPNPIFDTVPRRVEHWSIPGVTAKRAAESIAALTDGKEPDAAFAPMPSFWSDQYGMRLQAFGAPTLAETQTVIEGDLSRVGTEPVIVEYARDDRIVGIVGLGANPASLAKHRSRIADASTPFAAV